MLCLTQKQLIHFPATTGLDALTHAVEAYIGRSTTKQTRTDAQKAVSLIFNNLDSAVNHKNKIAEQNMLEAAHLAGRAFTRSYVGYVHAISHSLSGKYNLPHGWTNAVLLPIVLRRYGKVIWGKLAKLAVFSGLGKKNDNEQILAEKFITAIENKNKIYQIPNKIEALKINDIPKLTKYAANEANPLYPVPVLMDEFELEKIYMEVKK